MVDDALRQDLALALRGNVEAALAVSDRLQTLQGKPPAIELVLAGPPEGGTAIWGRCFATALGRSAEQVHSASFIVFERMGGYWHLLELLSDARALEPSRRQAFYAQFDDVTLLTSLVTALPGSATLRRSLRNLARSPTLRLRFRAAVPLLVDGLSHDDESAAALCNVACHSEAKVEAVDAGAVPRLVQRLREKPSHDVAEDLVACLGVLTGGCERGIAAWFELAVADGRKEAFTPLVQLLGTGVPPPLQCLALEVLGGLCAASPQFATWLVQQGVSGSLPALLRASDETLRASALQFAALIVDSEGFNSSFMNAGGVGALQGMLEEEQENGIRPMASDGRRGPTQRNLAQYLMSKLLSL